MVCYLRWLLFSLNSEDSQSLPAALKRKGSPFKPDVLFLVVGKRHHHRFFPVRGTPTDKSQNIEAGLVVSNGAFFRLATSSFTNSMSFRVEESRLQRFLSTVANGIVLSPLSSLPAEDGFL